MLNSLLFLGGLAAMVVIVWWAVTNDKAGPDGPTKGLLAMTDGQPRRARSQKKQAGRPRPTTQY